MPNRTLYDFEAVRPAAKPSVDVRNSSANSSFLTRNEISISQIKNNLDKYIVRPANAFGLGGFVFDVEGETTASLTASITDHFSEDNVAIQDHIAVKPKKVTLKTFVGELVHRLDDSTDTVLQNTVRKLTVLSGYLPALSDAASAERNVFLDEIGVVNPFDLDFDATVGSAVDLYSAVRNLTPPIRRQEQAYQYFKALCEQKIIVSLQTPFEFMSSMAVESVEARQGEETEDMSDFTITLKEMRFASTQTVQFNEDDYQSRGGAQREDVETQSSTTGANQSTLDGLIFGDDTFDPNEFSDLSAQLDEQLQIQLNN